MDAFGLRSFFGSVEKARYERTAHLHRSHGAEFLTAEAGDAFFAIDHGLSVFHRDDMSRADLSAFLASDAGSLFHAWSCAQCGSDEGGGKSTFSFEKHAFANVDILKIGYSKRVRISANVQLFDAFGDQPGFKRRLQGGNVLDAKSDQGCAEKIYLVWTG